MTKVIILGDQAEQKKELKKIEFVSALTPKYVIGAAVVRPDIYKNIELVCRDYDDSQSGSMDLMFAYDDNRNYGCIYLGHFNDGVV